MIVGPNDQPVSPQHECDGCGAAYHNRDAAFECCSDRTATDGGLKDVVDDEFTVVSAQISDPDGATAYQALAVHVEPENHPRLQRAGFHSPQTLFTLFSPSGRPLADYDPYQLASDCPGGSNGWVVDQLQALNHTLKQQLRSEA